ncbi:hypothetical protein DEIPH_ctg020orf0028 [Deinococcus phoenicis]|uniref:Cation efflux protein transmembrane domain-containing protein n=1 Tax=Deinococcus phoenicis TaxID=1476583 RepID=A0A016QR50_9DEIO|nr:cation transporter [Deinococcus phoenicis]EYB68590.1 hypothetical protein DEIPH_ctg020orf0028 [Deinococcus phoenicis]
MTLSSSSDTRREQQVLRLSIWLTVALAVLGLFVGVWVGSESIIFDGFFSGVNVLMTSAALLVAKLVARGGSRRFQYGYWHLEPLVSAFNGTVMGLICLVAFVNEVNGLRGGGQAVEVGVASAYTLLACIASLVMYLYVLRASRGMNSELLRIDAREWLIEGVLTAAIFVGFAIAALLGATGGESLAPYVDPVIVMVLALLLLPVPFGIVRRALREVFLIAPVELDTQVHAVLSEIGQRYGFQDYRSYVAKSGRVRYIDINIITPANFEVSGVAGLDRIREEIKRDLDEAGTQLWLTVSFTADPKWA